MLPRIRIYDSNFAHLPPGASQRSFGSTVLYPKFFQWVRDPNEYTDLAVFSEGCLHLAKESNAKIKIALFMEPRPIAPGGYESFVKYESDFDYILTHDSIFISKYGNKILKYYEFGAWVDQSQWGLYPKSKNVCIIASYKRQTDGHKMRHEIISKLVQKYKIDVYGSGYRPFANAIDVIKDYSACIVVENSKDGCYITEKFLTPAVLGCTPIYYGSDEIKDYFKGYVPLTFNNLEELEKILANLDMELEYYPDSLKNDLINEARERNLQISEDIMWKDHFERLL